MRIKDFYCIYCGTVKVDVIVDSLDVDQINEWCGTCEAVTSHDTVCNGGTKTRYRFCDLPTDPDFYRGQVKAYGASATRTNSDGSERKAVFGRGGQVIDDQDRFKETDKRQERREKIRFDTDKERGKTPLVFDQKKDNNA